MLIAPSPDFPRSPAPRFCSTLSDCVICILNTAVARSSELVLGGAHGPAMTLLRVDGRESQFLVSIASVDVVVAILIGRAVGLQLMCSRDEERRGE